MAMLESDMESRAELDLDLGERYYGGSKDLEHTYTRRIIDTIRQFIDGRFREGKRPARRDAHAFDNGCVRAIFRVDTDLDPQLQHGAFVPGKAYDAWIRFSNGNSEQRPQWWPDARGMAIKLLGVAGEKLSNDENETQDFVLISHPFLLVDYRERYQATLELFLKGGLFDQYVRSLLKLRGKEIWIATKVNLHWIVNPLFQQYWSMTPYRLGIQAPNKWAVKYTAKPRLGPKRSIFARWATALGSGFSLKGEMNDTLAGTEMWFDFYIQRSVDERTPVEDSTTEWRESVARLEHVAKIIIPSQDLMSAERAWFCENLSFSPWHCLPAHKPLGLVNRVRRAVYREISQHRHDLNRMPVREPARDEMQ
jgi:hypothetical protein